jgi:hypothetical protein
MRQDIRLIAQLLLECQKTMYWEKADGGYGNATLDANTGKELQLSATLGGDA